MQTSSHTWFTHDCRVNLQQLSSPVCRDRSSYFWKTRGFISILEVVHNVRICTTCILFIFSVSFQLQIQVPMALIQKMCPRIPASNQILTDFQFGNLLRTPCLRFLAAVALRGFDKFFETANKFSQCEQFRPYLSKYLKGAKRRLKLESPSIAASEKTIRESKSQ